MLEVKARGGFLVAASKRATIPRFVDSSGVNLSDGRLIMRRTCFRFEQMHRKIAEAQPSANLAGCS
ncbi:MAG TPA: hypothetical protein VF680_17955 [Allosphingosinicella sp.]|jgi:hypothetical protein